MFTTKSLYHQILRKMILILSKNKNELTTDEVMDWLYFYGADFHRINGEDLEIEDFSLELGTDNIKDSIISKFSEAGVIWYRRWYEVANNIQYFENIEPKEAANYFFYSKSEVSYLSAFVFKAFENKFWVDYPPSTNVNKLSVLDKARSLGFKIPETLVTNKKATLKQFLFKHKVIITKPISEVLFLNLKGYHFLTTTKKITRKNVDNLPDVFAVSLLQEMINKKFEIRVFILGEELYSMAIFSQNDSKTIDDFRNYNRERPNRFVPYILPKEIQKRIMDLMKALNLKSGSVDLIKSIDDEFVFLEINPNGQFGMVSKPCNYFLEKKMAEYLIKAQPKNLRKIANQNF